eukprot:74326-Amphidinium_carterae.2
MGRYTLIECVGCWCHSASLSHRRVFWLYGQSQGCDGLSQAGAPASYETGMVFPIFLMRWLVRLERLLSKPGRFLRT